MDRIGSAADGRDIGPERTAGLAAMTPDHRGGEVTVGSGQPDARVQTQTPDPDGAGDDHASADDFKLAFRHHAAGVAVVTLGSDRPYGLTITSLASVSAEPPVAVFSIGTDASAWPLIAAEDELAINLLAADQAKVSRRFAARGVDRFAGVDWSRLSTGEPVIHGAHSWLRGRISHRIPVGASYLITVDVRQVWTDPDRAPLVFYNRRHHGLGASSDSET